MNLIPYSARTWNEWMKLLPRWFPRRGKFAILDYTPNGIVISADPAISWRHPWSLNFRYEFDDETADDKGHWAAYAWPGFVNGRDAMVSRRLPGGGSEEVALTDENPAGLRLAWRNVLEAGSVSATDSGDILFAAAEGYPRAFDSLGVKPAAKGGSISQPGSITAESDPDRTREIRACDVYLSTPRPSSRQDVQIGNPFNEAQTVTFNTVINDNYFRSAKSRHSLRAASKWAPPQAPTSLDRLLGTYVETETDEILIATVYAISPPDASSDAQPDQSWECYAQYKVFWNLMHASRQQLGQAAQLPITLKTGLAGGVADTIFQQMLTPVNDAFTQLEAFLFDSDFTGRYWTV